MKKKSLVIMLSLLLALTMALSACSKKENNGEAPAATNDGNAASKETAKPEEPFKLTIMADLHTPNLPSDLVEKELEKKTNTLLEIQWVPDENYDEKMNTSIATGSLPQAMFIKNQSSFLLLREAVRQGNFWEIGPYLQEFPNLKNLNPDVLHNTSVDGKIYSLYQERPLSRQGLIYRKDWADHLKLSAPTTTDELYEMLKAFRNNDPDNNGAKDTIGLTDRSDLVYGAFKTLSSYFGTPNNWGEKDGKLLPEFMFPQYIETMKYMKKLRDEGLINQDFPVTSKKDQQDLFITGKAGAYIGSMPDVKSLYDKAVKINPNIVLDVQNLIAGPDGKQGVWSIPGYGALVLFPKSTVKTEDELKKILSFFDYLMSPEGANLIHYGIEGTDYTLENGKAKANPDSAVTDRDVKPYQALEIGGESTIPDRYPPFYNYDVHEKADQLARDNQKILINDPTAPLDSKTATEKGPQLQKLIIDATYKFMLGSTDEKGFQNAIEQWKKQGGDQIIEEFNAVYQK